MHKIYQSIFQNEKENGNCLQACVASILNLELDEVPHFADNDEFWFFDLVKWGLSKGFFVLHLDSWPPPEVYSIMCGQSPRGDFSHAVIAGPNGEIVHDPHPDGTGLVGDKRWCYLFVPVDPSKI